MSATAAAGRAHLHPLLSARIAGALHPLGALLFLGLGTPVGAVFTLLHGAGNGVLTIAQGTLPLALFGTQGYGQRLGAVLRGGAVAAALAGPDGHHALRALFQAA